MLDLKCLTFYYLVETSVQNSLHDQRFFNDLCTLTEHIISCCTNLMFDIPYYMNISPPFSTAALKKGTPSRTEEHHTGSHRSPEWMQSMSVRWHIMAADKGHLPSFLAIGDAFFYGKGGLPRYSIRCLRVSNA